MTWTQWAYTHTAHSIQTLPTRGFSSDDQITSQCHKLEIPYMTTSDSWQPIFAFLRCYVAQADGYWQTFCDSLSIPSRQELSMSSFLDCLTLEVWPKGCPKTSATNCQQVLHCHHRRARAAITQQWKLAILHINTDQTPTHSIIINIQNKNREQNIKLYESTLHQPNVQITDRIMATKSTSGHKCMVL